MRVSTGLFGKHNITIPAHARARAAAAADRGYRCTKQIKPAKAPHACARTLADVQQPDCRVQREPRRTTGRRLWVEFYVHLGEETCDEFVNNGARTMSDAVTGHGRRSMVHCARTHVCVMRAAGTRQLHTHAAAHFLLPEAVGGKKQMVTHSRSHGSNTAGTVELGFEF